MILPPGHELATLKCTILYVHILHPSIKTTNRYNALSYTWDDPTDTAVLELVDASNSHAGKVKVTRSLVTALQHFRHPTHHLAFWADQVCIDQSNVEEKEMQISLMKLIYERAGAVYAWLGPRSDDSDLAMEKIADSDSLFESASLLPTYNGTSRMTSHQGPRKVQETQTMALSAIFALLCRPWWSRTWILQESTAQMPTQTLLCCGDKQLQLSTFLRFTDKIRGTLVHPQALHLGFQKLLSLPFWPRFLAFLRGRQVSAGKRPLLSLVENVRDTTATDPRDKVSAMLNFALERNPSDSELRPDYSQTLRQTYTRLALWHIRKYQGLDVFARCGQMHGLGDHMASWTPDRRQGVAHVAFPKYTVNDDPVSEPLYSASGVHSDSLQVKAPLPVDTQHLTLCAVYLCEIGRAVPQTNAQMQGFEVEDTWRPVDGSLCCPLNNVTMEEVFRRTMYIDLKARFDDRQRINFERQRGDVPRARLETWRKTIPIWSI